MCCSENYLGKGTTVDSYGSDHSFQWSKFSSMVVIGERQSSEFWENNTKHGRYSHRLGDMAGEKCKNFQKRVQEYWTDYWPNKDGRETLGESEQGSFPSSGWIRGSFLVSVYLAVLSSGFKFLCPGAPLQEGIKGPTASICADGKMSGPSAQHWARGGGE
jgi:hypothetical protein